MLSLTLISITGCEKEVQKIYVDANGTEIPNPHISKFKHFNINPDDIYCDQNGLAYIRHSYGIMIPYLYNNTYGTNQYTCKELGEK